MADQEPNKKTIDDYKKDYEFFTGKASEISRSLAFAGIAIIWIFKNTNETKSIILPDELTLPLTLLVLALTFDLLQYIIGGLIWFCYYKFKENQIEKGKISSDSDIKAPAILPNIIHGFYWLKLFTIIIAYVFLFSFLYRELIC
jgi:hypothetical protein